jgi:hypothetical protein
MATQVLNNTEVESTNVFRLGDILPKSQWAPYGTATPAFVKGSERGSNASAGDGDCLNGAIVALGMEAIAALVIYGGLQLWHMVR